MVIDHVPQAGHAYTYTSDPCIVPPATPDAISETTAGQFILACVVWSPTSFAELEKMSVFLDGCHEAYCDMMTSKHTILITITSH